MRCIFVGYQDNEFGIYEHERSEYTLNSDDNIENGTGIPESSCYHLPNLDVIPSEILESYNLPLNCHFIRWRSSGVDDAVLECVQGENLIGWYASLQTNIDNEICQLVADHENGAESALDSLDPLSRAEWFINCKPDYCKKYSSDDEDNSETPEICKTS